LFFFLCTHNPNSIYILLLIMFSSVLISSWATYRMFQICILILIFATSLVAWWSELQTTSHEVPGSIPGSAVEIFPCRGRPPQRPWSG
jgi:MFS superfamily sulfate permease-like transporter